MNKIAEQVDETSETEGEHEEAKTNQIASDAKLALGAL